MALVLRVMRASTSTGSRVNVSSTSASTGLAPAYTMADMEATKVKPGTMTSSPGPMPNADSRIQIALVPELTASACPRRPVRQRCAPASAPLRRIRVVVRSVASEVAAAQHACDRLYFEFIDQSFPGPGMVPGDI